MEVLCHDGQQQQHITQDGCHLYSCVRNTNRVLERHNQQFIMVVIIVIVIGAVDGTRLALLGVLLFSFRELDRDSRGCRCRACPHESECVPVRCGCAGISCLL